MLSAACAAAGALDGIDQGRGNLQGTSAQRLLERRTEVPLVEPQQ